MHFDNFTGTQSAQSAPSATEPSSVPAVNGEPQAPAPTPASGGDAPPAESDGAPPKLVKDLESLVVAEKANVVLECQISGRNTFGAKNEFVFDSCECFSGSPTEVVWLRNGKEVKSSDSHKQEKAGDTYRLSIKQAVSDDSGVYQCEAFHPSGSVASVATVLVQCKSLLIVSLLNIFVKNVNRNFYRFKQNPPLLRL